MIDEIFSYRKKNKRLVIGLMSGTSADGIDTALVEIENSFIDTRFRLIDFKCFDYPERTRKKIFNLFDTKKANVELLSECNFELGRLFAQSCKKLISGNGLKIRDIDLISSHGQTVYHDPCARIPSTLQIGESSVIAKLTGVMVVSDFRTGDVALGGQGAPFVPYADFMLFRHPEKNRVVLNIGGISNITFIPKGAGPEDVTAFDTGPGNMAIDRLVGIFTGGKKMYDKNGRIAQKGRVNKKLLYGLLKDRFVLKPPPKSTGRENYGMIFVEKLLKENKEIGFTDIIATVSAFTSESIAINVEKFIPEKVDEIIVSGGGACNDFLTGYLKKRMNDVKFYESDFFGIPVFAKEAIEFALLGNDTLMMHPVNLPNVTGAKRSAIMGKVTFGG